MQKVGDARCLAASQIEFLLKERLNVEQNRNHRLTDLENVPRGTLQDSPTAASLPSASAMFHVEHFSVESVASSVRKLLAQIKIRRNRACIKIRHCNATHFALCCVQLCVLPKTEWDAFLP